MKLSGRIFGITSRLCFFVEFFFLYRDNHFDKIKNLILDLLCSPITESDSVSIQLLNIILSNIMEPLKSQQENSFRLAKELLLHNIVGSGGFLKNYIKRVGVLSEH